MASNPRLLLAVSGLHFVLFPIPVITLFWKDQIAALLFRLAFVVAGPPIGALVDRAGLETALGVLAVVFTTAGLAALAAFARARA